MSRLGWPPRVERAGGAGRRPRRQAQYQGCAIAQPADDQTFTNVEALTVVVRTDPALRPGDQVFLAAGRARRSMAARRPAAQFTLTPVDRGTHTLQAVVRDSDGGLMCQTPGGHLQRAPALGAESGQSPIR